MSRPGWRERRRGALSRPSSQLPSRPTAAGCIVYVEISLTMREVLFFRDDPSTSKKPSPNEGRIARRGSIGVSATVAVMIPQERAVTSRRWAWQSACGKRPALCEKSRTKRCRRKTPPSKTQEARRVVAGCRSFVFSSLYCWIDVVGVPHSLFSCLWFFFLALSCGPHTRSVVVLIGAIDYFLRSLRPE